MPMEPFGLGKSLQYLAALGRLATSKVPDRPIPGFPTSVGYRMMPPEAATNWQPTQAGPQSVNPMTYQDVAKFLIPQDMLGVILAAIPPAKFGGGADDLAKVAIAPFGIKRAASEVDKLVSPQQVAAHVALSKQRIAKWGMDPEKIGHGWTSMLGNALMRLEERAIQARSGTQLSRKRLADSLRRIEMHFGDKVDMGLIRKKAYQIFGGPK